MNDERTTLDAPVLALAEGLAQHARAWSLRSGAGGDVAAAAADAARAVSLALAGGHVCVTLVDLDASDAPAGIDRLRRTLLASGVVGTDDAPGAMPLVLDADGRLYLHRYFDYERRLARRVLLAARASAPGITAAQRDALRAQLATLFAANPNQPGDALDWQKIATALALRGRLAVISGGPGTGKTTTVVNLLACLIAQQPGCRIALAAPTGKAAARMSEAIRERAAHLPPVIREQLPSDASTIHRLLGVTPSGFVHHAGRRLAIDALVIDEASMLDTQLMAALLDAMPADAALLLVGDVDQLPSIGPGQVLADLIGSGAVPVVRLSEIFRQAAESGIVRNAHRINHGELPAFARAEDGPADCYGIRVTSPEDAEAKLLDLVLRRIPERFGLDPLSEVQVLTPVNRGRLGTLALNELLQAELNPDPPLALPHGQGRLALGDRVMQLENDHEREVYNGDVGRVTGMDPKARTVEVTIDGRALSYAADELDRLALAYAVTVHKAQGSEYPAVVLPLLRQHGRMLRRNLLYTALTRAQRLVVLLTEPDALERAVRDTSDLRRRTLLRQRLTSPEPHP